MFNLFIVFILTYQHLCMHILIIIIMYVNAHDIPQLYNNILDSLYVPGSMYIVCTCVG